MFGAGKVSLIVQKLSLTSSGSGYMGFPYRLLALSKPERPDQCDWSEPRCWYESFTSRSRLFNAFFRTAILQPEVQKVLQNPRTICSALAIRTLQLVRGGPVRRELELFSDCPVLLAHSDAKALCKPTGGACHSEYRQERPRGASSRMLDLVGCRKQELQIVRVFQLQVGGYKAGCFSQDAVVASTTVVVNSACF